MKKKFPLILSLMMVPPLFIQAQGTAGGSASAIKMNVQNAASGSTNPVRLSTMEADVQVMGNIATTTLDMVFVNDTNRVLEGEFEFPLGEHESITGYALDINGKLRQGVVVEKDKGRQVFEAVVRQGIDPGLVEMTAGNNFKARVYPLPAKGSRHVQVTYQSELHSSPRQYTFSALSADTLDQFDFRITVLDMKKEAAPKSAENSFLTFDEMNSGYTAQISKKNFVLNAPVSIAIPNKPGTEASGTVFTEEEGKDTFFYYYQPIAATEVAKKLPQRLVIYYDISDSMKRRNMDAEFAVLTAYLSKAAPASVTVVPFCNELHEARQFSGSADKIADDIKAFIQAQGFDGATNLGYDFAALFPADEVLVFTDGIGNWDDSRAVPKVAAKRDSHPTVSTINSSASANHSWLQKTAQQDGGQYINLCTTSTADALAMLTKEPLRLIHAEYDGNAVSDVYPLDGSIVTNDFSLSGKLRRKQAVVKLSFGHGNTIEENVSITVSAVDGIPARNVVYQWAVKKIHTLDIDYEANKEEIIALAKQYGIVTKDTSLIVLDSVQDYVRYGIVPPEELRAEYDRIMAGRATGAKPSNADSNEIPQEVYRTFEEFRKWWNTSLKEFKKKKPKKAKGQGSVSVDAVMEESVMMQEAEAVYDMAPAEMVEEAAPVMERRSETVTRSTATRRATGAGRAAANSAPMSSPGENAGSTATASSSVAEGTIQLQAWNPNAEYLSVLKRTRTEEMYAKYLELKANYASSPAFYMEVSDYFAEEGLSAESLRILSNLAELELENTDILRALGNKLVERELYALAVPVFENLVKLRGEIPQFYRDLGMAYFYCGEVQKAVDTLYSVVCRRWDNRFAEVQQIALNDMNAIIATAGKGEVDTSTIDKKLLQNFDLDVRVVLTWNIDNCDVDLWVTDKDGEKCYYANKLTANGGRISRDFTQGYGPEEFCIKCAPGGKLKIEANYFGSRQQKLLQPVTVQAEVYTNFGRKNQKRQILTLQLDAIKQTFFVGNVEF